MNTLTHFRLTQRPRRGAIAFLVLLLLVALLASAAFSVDVAYMHLTRAELRRATDAAARAGMETLHRTEDADAVTKVVQQVAKRNVVAGAPLVIREDQIVLGRGTQGRNGWEFTAWEEPYNSVRVVGSRANESAQGSVSLFFGKMLGTSEFEPVLESTVMKDVAPKRDFVLVVDRSGSMGNAAAGRGRQSRWQALRSAVGGFFTALDLTQDDELAGLASYSSSSTIDHWLTDDPASIQNRLGSINVGGWTNIHSGVENGTTVLSDSRARDDASQIMVVMTDGHHNRGPEPVQAAEVAAAKGIVIFTITFGNGADVKRMKAVADATGGKHYHAPTAAELQEVFQQVVTDSANLIFIR